MLNRTWIHTWVIGGAITWLVYAITLSILPMWLFSPWGKSFSIQVYNLGASKTPPIAHTLLIGMVAAGFFVLEATSFLHLHIPWMDAATYNWRTMDLPSSLATLFTGGHITTDDRDITLIGAMLGVLLIGGSLLFILNNLIAR